MISIIKNVVQLKGYWKELRYPKARATIYLLSSIFLGWFLASGKGSSSLPLLTFTAILFGFTVNAIVLLSNSSSEYVGTNCDHSEELETYYKNHYIFLYIL